MSRGGRVRPDQPHARHPRQPAHRRADGVRAILSRVAARWRALQEAQRDAWMAAASEDKSNSRLGQSGPLSGFQLFAKINCTLAQFGQEQVDAPPARRSSPTWRRQSLVITNTGGAIALKLTCPTSPGENTIVRGSEPRQPGPRDLQRLPDPRHVPGPRAGLGGHHEPLHGPLRRAAGRQEGVRPGQPVR